MQRITIIRRVIAKVATDPSRFFDRVFFPGETYRISHPHLTRATGDHSILVLAGVGCTALPNDAWRTEGLAPGTN